MPDRFARTSIVAPELKDSDPILDPLLTSQHQPVEEIAKPLPINPLTSKSPLLFLLKRRGGNPCPFLASPFKASVVQQAAVVDHMIRSVEQLRQRHQPAIGSDLPQAGRNRPIVFGSFHQVRSYRIEFDVCQSFLDRLRAEDDGGAESLGPQGPRRP